MTVNFESRTHAHDFKSSQLTCLIPLDRTGLQDQPFIKDKDKDCLCSYNPHIGMNIEHSDLRGHREYKAVKY